MFHKIRKIIFQLKSKFWKFFLPDFETKKTRYDIEDYKSIREFLAYVKARNYTQLKESIKGDYWDNNSKSPKQCYKRIKAVDLLYETFKLLEEINKENE